MKRYFRKRSNSNIRFTKEKSCMYEFQRKRLHVVWAKRTLKWKYNTYVYHRWFEYVQQNAHGNEYLTWMRLSSKALCNILCLRERCLVCTIEKKPENKHFRDNMTPYTFTVASVLHVTMEHEKRDVNDSQKLNDTQCVSFLLKCSNDKFAVRVVTWV